MTILRPLVTLFCVANTRLEIWSHLYACMSMSIKLLAAIGPFSGSSRTIGFVVLVATIMYDHNKV